METFDDLEERMVTMSGAQFRTLIELYKMHAPGMRP